MLYCFCFVLTFYAILVPKIICIIDHWFTSSDSTNGFLLYCTLPNKIDIGGVVQ